jgi:hypothetical protein
MLRVRDRVVVAPSGVEWRIGRLWVSRRLPRWRRVHLGEGASDAAWNIPIPDVGSVDDLAAVVLIVVGAVVFAVVLVPLLLFGIELIIVGLLIAAGILGRSLLGRPWIVRASPASDDDRVVAWKVSGIRRSTRVIDEVATSLTNGLPPAPAEAAEPLPGSPASAVDRVRRARWSS